MKVTMERTVRGDLDSFWHSMPSSAAHGKASWQMKPSPRIIVVVADPRQPSATADELDDLAYRLFRLRNQAGGTSEVAGGDSVWIRNRGEVQDDLVILVPPKHSQVVRARVRRVEPVKPLLYFDEVPD